MNDFSLDKATILLIDPQQEILRLLVDTLSAAGYHCCVAEDGEQACQIAQQRAPDLIIADVHLEGENGPDVCRRVIDQAHLGDAPTMFLSRSQSPDVIRRTYEGGGAFHLRKPFDPSVLLELVDRALWMPTLVSSQSDTAY